MLKQMGNTIVVLIGFLVILGIFTFGIPAVMKVGRMITQ
jgi:hypothetical protein